MRHNPKAPRQSVVIPSAQETALEWAGMADGLVSDPNSNIDPAGDLARHIEAERKERQRIETERQRAYDRAFR
jgi:hypothetical protein